MKYNAEWDKWVTKDGLVFRINNHCRHMEPELIYCNLKPGRNGYISVTKYVDNKHRRVTSVHRLVWETFIGKIPDGMEIDHINGDKTDNRLDNLQCVTHIENLANVNTKAKQRKIYDSTEWRANVSAAIKGKPKSIFGKKFYEHFGFVISHEDKSIRNLYTREKRFYDKNGKCSWEA